MHNIVIMHNIVMAFNSKFERVRWLSCYSHPISVNINVRSMRCTRVATGHSVNVSVTCYDNVICGEKPAAVFIVSKNHKTDIITVFKSYTTDHC